MKITKDRLKEIIKEEIENSTKEVKEADQRQKPEDQFKSKIKPDSAGGGDGGMFDTLFPSSGAPDAATAKNRKSDAAAAAKARTAAAKARTAAAKARTAAAKNKKAGSAGADPAAADPAAAAMKGFQKFQKDQPKATYELSKMIQKHGREKIDKFMSTPEGISKLQKAIERRLKKGGERVRIGKDGKPTVMSPKASSKASSKDSSKDPSKKPPLPKNWRSLPKDNPQRVAFRKWYIKYGPGKNRRRR